MRDKIKEENPWNGDDETEKPYENNHRTTHQLAKSIVEGVVDAIKAA